MSLEPDNPAVMEPLRALIAEARNKGLWLHCKYQDLWFSPDKLEAENKAGRFRWAAVNWTLRDPRERLAEALGRVERAMDEARRIAKEIGRGELVFPG